MVGLSHTCILLYFLDDNVDDGIVPSFQRGSFLFPHCFVFRFRSRFFCVFCSDYFVVVVVVDVVLVVVVCCSVAALVAFMFAVARMDLLRSWFNAPPGVVSQVLSHV